MNNASLQLSSNDNTDRIEFSSFCTFSRVLWHLFHRLDFERLQVGRDTAKSDLKAQPCASDKTLAMALKAADWTSATKFSSFSSQVCFSILVVVTVVVAAFFFP